jgi:hypothetical protein
MKVASFVCCEGDIGGMVLFNFLIDSEVLDQKAVGNVIGNEVQGNGFAFLDRDFCGLKAKALRVHFDRPASLLSV